MNIQVKIKNVYGAQLIYPVCDKAQLFADMVGQTTLTLDDIAIIKRLGYTVEVITDSPKTL